MPRHRSAQLTDRELRQRLERRREQMRRQLDLVHVFSPLGVVQGSNVVHRVPCAQCGRNARAVVALTSWGEPFRLHVECDHCELLPGIDTHVWPTKFN